ncbi:DUF4179 domain-containing protein [Oscillibacter sp. MSJ-2]|uniref:DUF4179 domain-containing protein n=1 Tax=Dysosmobacter acutus TaxID=2841504 RepID=A0ABS6FA95_9FIRM|nr:DUF4179 domain-containing protein [Dysosmobacter acutus]MBU5627211.1 DUF4179 domain-containing protein [Dysosmobacter acutus]
MNRKEEYSKLMEEVSQVPPELAYTVQRAQARLRTRKRLRKFLGVPVGSVLVFLVSFTLLVNLLPTFAYACGRVPVLRELAKAVSWSASLSAAVEHEYVQPIEQEQTENNVTARVEYVIVDQKQLIIFYSLDSGLYEHLEIMPELHSLSGEPMEGFSLMYGDYGVPNGELNYLTADFENSMPDGLQLKMQVADYSHEMDYKEPEESGILAHPEHEEMEYVAEFTFSLHFDSYYTAQGDRIAVDQDFEIDGQTLTLQEAEIYPTHIRLNFTDDPENTAWLKDLEFYLENEEGQRFDPVSNGVTATGRADSPMMDSFRVESSFFASSKHLTLHITGATWLDKEREKVELNLRECTAEFLPQGVEFIRSEEMKNGWILTFRAPKREESAFYQLWSQTFYDAQGHSYEIRSWSTGIDPEGGEDTFSQEFPLVGYTEGSVWLEPAFTRMETLTLPVAVDIR